MASLTVDWELTAITVYCDRVKDDITLIVYKDSSTKCTGYSKYSSATIIASGIARGKDGRPLQEVRCEYPECRILAQYKEKIFSEEGGIE